MCSGSLVFPNTGVPYLPCSWPHYAPLYPQRIGGACWSARLDSPLLSGSAHPQHVAFAVTRHHATSPATKKRSGVGVGVMCSKKGWAKRHARVRRNSLELFNTVTTGSEQQIHNPVRSPPGFGHTWQPDCTKNVNLCLPVRSS